MKDSLHEVVRLLVQRMESNPEEFVDTVYPPDHVSDRKYISDNRWWYSLNLVQEYGTAEDKEAVATPLRVIKLKVAHEWMMDELFNGEQRRREEEDNMARASGRVAAINSRLQQPLSPYTTQQQGGLMNQAKTIKLPFPLGDIL